MSTVAPTPVASLAGASAGNFVLIAALIGAVAAVAAQIVNAVATEYRENRSRRRREARVREIAIGVLHRLTTLIGYIVNDGMALDPRQVDEPTGGVRAFLADRSLMLDLDPDAIAAMYELSDTIETALSAYRNMHASWDRDRAAGSPKGATEGFGRNTRALFIRSLLSSTRSLKRLGYDVASILKEATDAAKRDRDHPLCQSPHLLAEYAS